MTLWALVARCQTAVTECGRCDSVAAALLRQMGRDEKLQLMQHRNPAIPRLGLSAYSWWNEALHGVARNGKATVYPMPIALAATWDTALVAQVYRQVALEARHKRQQAGHDSATNDYQGLTFFTPNINLVRDPRWGRGMETFGEDPWLSSQMAMATLRGLQHRLPNGRYASLACLKHLAVHSGPEGSRHQFDARVSARDLHTTYLSAFNYTIRHGDVQQVMCAYNRLNGTPCCTDSVLLVALLRHRWHYDGLIVTDCWALNDTWERDPVTPRHKTYPTATVAAEAAFGSEVDLECGSGLEALREAVAQGLIAETKIDEHLHRILRARCLVGIDDSTTPLPPLPQNNALPYQAAVESLVLLKNDNGTLPIAFGNDDKSCQKIVLVGPNIDDSVMALGNYHGDPYSLTTLRQAFEQMAVQRFGNREQHLYCNSLCGHVDSMGQHTTLPQGKAFWNEVEQADVIVFAGGLSPQIEGEELQVELPGFHRGDRTTIELPEVQTRLIKELKERSGKPLVLVLCTGGAIALEEVTPYCDAIMVAWYGGERMGEAVCHALTHSNIPFGRLPITFYRNTSQLPPFDDYRMAQRTYRYMNQEPLYRFGHGLNYNTARHIESVEYRAATRTVSGRIAVEGAIEHEVVQVYLTNVDDPEGPRQQLVGFQRLAKSEDGQSSTFAIALEEECFYVYNDEQQQMVPPNSGCRYQITVVCGEERKTMAIKR